jgi:phosphotransacetylase
MSRSSLSLSHRAPAATFLESPAYSPARLPHSLLVATDYLMQTNPTAQQVVDKWVQAVQDTLGLAVEKIHLDSVLEDAGYAAESVERLRNTMGESANWYVSACSIADCVTGGHGAKLESSS